MSSLHRRLCQLVRVLVRSVGNAVTVLLVAPLEEIQTKASQVTVICSFEVDCTNVWNTVSWRFLICCCFFKCSYSLTFQQIKNTYVKSWAVMSCCKKKKNKTLFSLLIQKSVATSEDVLPVDRSDLIWTRSWACTINWIKICSARTTLNGKYHQMIKPLGHLKRKPRWESRGDRGGGVSSARLRFISA